MKTSFIRSILVFLFLFSIQLLNAQSIGGTINIFKGQSSYCSATNDGVLELVGKDGNILYWQSSTNGGAVWNNIAITTTNIAYFNLAQTTCYRAVVQKTPFPADTSTQFCITVYQPSVSGVISGGGLFCGNSGAGSLTLTGNTGNPVYWENSINGGLTWNKIVNTSTNLNYTNITQSVIYRVAVQNTPTCNIENSTPVSFSIDSVTVAGTVTGATNVCITANSGKLNLVGSVGEVQGWESSINSGNTWQAIASTNKFLSYSNLTQTIWYRAIVKSGSCLTDTTAVAIIKVSLPTVVGTLSGGATYCGVPATGALTLNGFKGDIISWSSSIDNGVSWLKITNTDSTESYTNMLSTKWYRAVVKNGACSIDTSTIQKVYVSPQTVAGSINGNKTICYGLNEDTSKVVGNIGSVLAWSSSTNNGATWTPVLNKTTWLYTKNLTQTTLFKAIVQSGNCNIDTTLARTITVLPMNAVDAGIAKFINFGESLQLNGSGLGTPLWTPPTGLNNTAVLNPIATPQSTTTYTLFITDLNNCINSDTVTVTVIKSFFNGKITNLFTPNNDGVNDTWYIENIENFPGNEVTVYNIDGRVVFTKKEYTNDWRGTYNGKELPDGTYFYVIRFNNTNQTFKGTVDILGK
ncbi:MAG: gliding motility-associated C-terminal domain-containing protein [Bacteroidia bacterium]